MGEHLKLYNIDMKYIRNLAKVDDHVMSVSPQTGKKSRPFVGVVIVCEGKEYCIPLSSPKAKHEKMKNGKDFAKMVNKSGKLIGVLNFNNMIPVSQSVLAPVDTAVHPGDSPATRAYKGLLNDELDWCNANRSLIERKATKLYAIVTESPDQARMLVSRCCDFRKLEGVLRAYVD